jgi:hypothetical protein
LQKRSNCVKPLHQCAEKRHFNPVAGSFQGARVVLEAIGRDEQEAINKPEGLLLRFRDEEGGG